MTELKPLPPSAVESALEKARHYRLLNEPAEAESICRDILEIEPQHPGALVTLVLALSDQLEETPSAFEIARRLIPQLAAEYDRAYYEGILYERRAKALLGGHGPGSGPLAFQCLQEALARFERARALAPPENPDAILRWNTCVRLIAKRRDLRPPHADAFHPLLE